MPMGFEVLMDDNKLKAGISNAKKNVGAMFDDFVKGAKDAGTAIDGLGSKLNSVHVSLPKGYIPGSASRTTNSSAKAGNGTAPIPIPKERWAGQPSYNFGQETNPQFGPKYQRPNRGNGTAPPPLPPGGGGGDNGGNGSNSNDSGSGGGKKGFFSTMVSNAHLNRDRRALSSRSMFEGAYFTRLRSQLTNAALAYVSFYAAKRAAVSLLRAGADKEEQYFKLSVPFGNKANVANAMNFADNLGKGGTPFKRTDLIEGFKSMMEMGLDPTKGKNFNTVGNIAGKTGNDFSKVASDLSSAAYGNSDVLRQYGFTNKQVFSLDRMVNQRPDARRNVIMGILNQDGRYKNGMKEFANTWKGMTNQMSGHWERFKEGIVGDPKDKDSLFSKFKAGYQSVLDWLSKNQLRISRFATAIGTGLKWVLRQVLDFGRFIARRAEAALSIFDGSEQNFRDKMSKMVLWLELTKEKLVRFFDRWGGLIWGIVKIWAASKIVGMFTGGIGRIAGAFGTLTGSAAGALGVIGRLNIALLAIYGTLEGITALDNSWRGMQGENKIHWYDYLKAPFDNNIEEKMKRQDKENQKNPDFVAKENLQRARGKLYGEYSRTKGQLFPGTMADLGYSKPSIDSLGKALSGGFTTSKQADLLKFLDKKQVPDEQTPYYKKEVGRVSANNIIEEYRTKKKLNPGALRSLGVDQTEINELVTKLNDQKISQPEKDKLLAKTVSQGVTIYIDKLEIKANDPTQMTRQIQRAAGDASSRAGYNKPPKR